MWRKWRGVTWREVTWRDVVNQFLALLVNSTKMKLKGLIDLIPQMIDYDALWCASLRNILKKEELTFC